MDKIDVPNNGVAESDDDIKIVTIGGKQLELKYEFPRKRVDIFGLHTNNKRNGTERKRPSKSDSSTNRRSDENRIIGHKKNSFDKKQKTFVETNNNSNYSFDSNESSIIESVKSLSKVDKLMRRLESNESLHKKNSSIEQVVNKLKKDKEPVKIANRFDKLLSSNTLDDYNLSDKNSAKKNKKKKNKSSLSFDNNSDENRNKNVTQNQLIDQNVSENIRTDSVPQTESSFEENPNNNKLFQTNNNLNNRYSTKSDKNFLKLNNEEEKHTKQEILRIYKNPIHETYNLSQRESIEETVGLFDNSVDQTLNQIIESSSSEESEKESAKETKLNDEMAANAQQNNLWSTSNRYPNGRLTLRPMTPKDKTENKSPLLGQQLVKVIKEERVFTNLSFMNCSLIIGGIVAFLTIYTFTILRQFCNCN